jgi:hypothetical protein
MTVKPLRERGRYHVESASHGDDYLVDLLEYRRNGFCGCKDFATKIEPKWNAGEVPERKFCKHIRACRDYLIGLLELTVTWMNEDQLQKQVDRIIFRWAREESNAKINPQRYGTR